jgi:hypothetical protein
MAGARELAGLPFCHPSVIHHLPRRKKEENATLVKVEPKNGCFLFDAHFTLAMNLDTTASSDIAGT